MRLAEVQKILEAKLVWGEEYLDREVQYGCASDLLSDCLAFAPPRAVLLTGLTQCQVIRTAEIIEAQAVVFVRGKIPTSDIIELARQKGIPVLVSEKLLFACCGLLYMAGLQGA